MTYQDFVGRKKPTLKERIRTRKCEIARTKWGSHPDHADLKESIRASLILEFGRGCSKLIDSVLRE